MGIERSKDAFNKADLLILVLDASLPLEDTDKELIKMSEGRACITVLNKTDMAKAFEFEGLDCSFKNGTGIEDIYNAIEKFVDGGKLRRNSDVMITNVRHSNLIEKAIAEIDEAISMCQRNEAMDFIEVNVKAAFDYLGEITGETASDEVINEVFSRFCLGK